jgi:prophage regulatory protein
MQERAIRFIELKRTVGASRSTIFRWERDGKFPKHFCLGKNSIAWLSSDIDAWLKERAKTDLKILPKATHKKD